MTNTLKQIFKNLRQNPKILIAFIAGSVVALTIPLLIYLAPNHEYKDLIQTLENKLPLPLFGIQMVAILVLFLILFKDFKNWIRGFFAGNKLTRIIGIFVVIFTVAISIFAAENIEARHRVQSDESVFMSVAQNMYHNQKGSTCNQGYFQDGNLECVATSNSFKTKGLSFLYTIGMPFFGKDLHWIFNLEFLLLPLSILLMFLAVVAWTKQPLLAFFASLLMALQPTVLFQFRSMSVEPLYIFLSALSLLFFKWAYEKNTWKHWALLALILAFFAQTRQETVFCFIPFILFALPKLLSEKNYNVPVYFVTLSVFTIPVLLMISAYQGFGFQGGEFEAHGHFWEDVKRNWEVMTMDLDKNGDLQNPFLTYFNYLFAVGGVYLVVRAFLDIVIFDDQRRFTHLKMLAFIVLYHIQSYVILENVSGDFTIQINQRYSLVMIPTMAFLAALPQAHLIQFLGTQKPKIEKFFIAAMGVAVVCGFTIWTFHYKDQFQKNIMYNRNHLTVEEHEIWNWLNQQPEKDRLFIYGRPWHFIGYGVSSIHYNTASRMSDSDLKDLIQRYKGEVYYIRGLDCWDSQTYHKKAVEHRIPTTCDVFERDMDMDDIHSILITNNYYVNIKKFNGRMNYNPVNIITVNEPQYIPPTDSTEDAGHLRVSFEFMEKSPVTKNWTFTLYVNEDKGGNGPYMKGKFLFKTPEARLHEGFNTIRYVVSDNKSKKVLADISKYYFHNLTGAKPLSEITPTQHSQGWGNFHTNLSVEGNRLKVAGRFFDSGLGTHAPSTTVFNVEGKYKILEASFGLDEESLCSDGAKVQVVGDGRVLYESANFVPGFLGNMRVNIAGVQQLTINTLSLETNNCDHVDILNPVLIP